MEFTVYKKAEDVDEPASRGAKKKKVKGSKEISPAAETKVPTADGEVETKQRAGRHPCDCQTPAHSQLSLLWQDHLYPRRVRALSLLRQPRGDEGGAGRA